MTSRMDGPFLANLALTFTVGGLWVMASTAVALFFIGLTQSPEAAAGLVGGTAAAYAAFLLSACAVYRVISRSF
jgi:hypothetical protein